MMTNTNPVYELVMVIDDTPEDLYITNRVILKNNFASTVLQFSMAQEALKYLQDNQSAIDKIPQIIFLDIHMPVMNGFEFLKAYDRLPDFIKQHNKIYVISSTFDEGDIINVRRDKNAKDFFEKPLTREAMEKVLQQKI